MNIANLVTVITEDEIKASIMKVASDYGKAYENQQLTIVAELSGVFVFVADLIRELPIDVTIQFVTTPDKAEMNKKIKIDLGLNSSLKDKNVLILTDIFYEGNALKRMHDIVSLEEPRDIKVLSLIDKQCKNRKVDLEVHSLFKIDEDFIVGYGLTHNESYRGLKSIYKLVETKAEEEK